MVEGRRITLEEAVSYACQGRGGHSRPASGWDSLTPSERRVVSLVAQRLSNAKIANRLFISIPTVKSHLNHVCDKLHVANRRQLAVLARHCSEGL
jgi:DNA-binding CsgD family transcriptional regulator